MTTSPDTTEPAYWKPHDLQGRAQGSEAIVGRQSTGRFISVPLDAWTVLEHLQAGDRAQDALNRVPHVTFDVQSVQRFMSRLASMDLLMLKEPDEESARLPVSWPNVSDKHVGWLTHPGTVTVATGGALLCIPLALGGGQSIDPREAVWGEWVSLVLVASACITWSSIYLHELAHLLTARAYAVTGRIRFGTRLQFLCAQTEISGMWLRPRRQRMVTYLSGMVVNGLIATGACLLHIFGSGPWPIVGIVLFIHQFQLLIGQARVYTRTDLFFVMQDGLNCRNLYNDGMDYVRYLRDRLMRKSVGDPLATLAPREAKIIRGYTALMVPSVLVTVGAYLWVDLPILIRMIMVSVENIETGSPVRILDAVIVIGYIVGMRTLWLTTSIRQRRERRRKRSQFNGSTGEAREMKEGSQA